jgi:class 3 adenylate cyclase
MERRVCSEMEHLNRSRRWFEDLESFSRRVLTTVLFTDVVDSTGRLLELGDRTWAELLRSHHTRFRERLGRFGGREVDAAGDGFLAAFDVPTYAVAFACSFHDEVIELGLEVRTGVHTGECELEDGRLRGVAVHVGARLASIAGPGEVLVSATVRDVVAGGELRFADRGLHELRGVPGQRRLFAALWNGTEALVPEAAATIEGGGRSVAPSATEAADGYRRRRMKGVRARDHPGSHA